MAKAKWLKRRFTMPGPYLTLCLSAEEYRAAMHHLKIFDMPAWVNDGASATAHACQNDVGDLVVIVCMRDWEDLELVESIGLLTHEAVHVWQQWCDRYGETHPGAEQEAYAIQSISQELIHEFFQRLKEH